MAGLVAALATAILGFHMPADAALAAAERDLRAAYARGYRSLALVLMHGYRYPAHEARLADLARVAGFTQVSVRTNTRRFS